jgi:transposase
VRRWVEQAEAADAEAGPRTSAERLAREEKAELAALRRENAALKRDVEILKRATAFFAKETR